MGKRINLINIRNNIEYILTINTLIPISNPRSLYFVAKQNTLMFVLFFIIYIS